MEIFKNRTVSELAKRVRAFLALHTGLISRRAQSERTRRQTASENGKIIAPARGLAQSRGAAYSSGLSGESTPIFFVVGYQKSGTTWLMKMLDSHPEILCQGEGRPFGRNWKQESLKRRRTSYPPASLYNAISSAEDLRYWVERSVWSKSDDTDEHLDNLTRLAIEYFLTQRLLKTGKRLVGDKTVLLSAETIKEISVVCPDAKIIHIIRDGRDVMVSAMHHRWNQAEDQGGTSKITDGQKAKREAYRKDPDKLLKTGEGIFPKGWLARRAADWSTKVSKTVEDGPALLGANYVEVRYEDLLVDTEEELRRLLQVLGADTSEQTVKHCVDTASFEKLAGGRQRGQEAASFFRKGIVGDWNNVFTDRDKRDFKVAAGDPLIELGYEEDHNW